MKILIISDAWYPQVNGVVRTYEHLRDELERRGHDVKVIGPADFRFTIPTPGYAEIRLALFARARLKKMIDEYGPDRVHIATEGPLGWAGQKICKASDIGFTTSYHTQFPDYVAKRIAKYLTFLYPAVHKLAVNTVRKFHNGSKTIFVATPSLEQTLRDWKFTTPMMRLTRGVNLDIFNTEGKDIFPDLPRPIAIYVGRIAIEKNLEDFLEMDWDGSKVLVGDGPSLSALKRKYPDAHFVGKKIGEELAAHYRSSDVFAFPSRTDTFGIVLIEALAAGLPVAAYPVMGPVDIITSPTLGILDDDLGKAAKEALKHGSPEDRHLHVEKFYTWEKAADQFLAGLNIGFEDMPEDYGKKDASV